MVSLVLEGESSLAIQQKVDDAGFPNVVVTQLGGDCVFIHCNNGEDTWKVFDDAVHFFGMLFTTVRKWMPSEVKYERGAWLRIYGVPIHAWTEDFFRLCVLDTGRFLHIDDCTVDKARLDYARVLVSTTQIEIVNKTAEFLIDNCNYVIKLVEEWGCNLGEDAFMTEEVIDSRPET